MQAVTELAQRISLISESSTMKVAAEADRLRREGVDVVDFSAGEPDFPTPDNIKRAAIRAIGPEHFMLSSDAGIPLLPQTVEAYRLLAAMLRAYGMSEIEMRQLMTGSAKEMLTLS